MPIQRMEVHVAPAHVEWQGKLKLRSRYEEARSLVEPLLAQNPLQQHGTTLYRALHKLHERYPDLSPLELEALVASVVRGISSRTAKR